MLRIELGLWNQCGWEAFPCHLNGVGTLGQLLDLSKLLRTQLRKRMMIFTLKVVGGRVMVVCHACYVGLLHCFRFPRKIGGLPWN